MIDSTAIIVPDGWQTICLGDVAKIQSGTGFPVNRQGRQNGQYPFIKVSDMTLQGNETYIQYANNYVDKKDVEELKATIFAPGTIVFPKVGAAIATNKKRALTAPTIIDNNMMGVTVVDPQKCDARFLHAWFEFIDLSQLANVSAVPSITSKSLKRSMMLLPPLSEQISIAFVLDSIDEAIKRNEAVIIAAERLRSSLLHELLTRGIPGWHTAWRDVPDIGMIPVDWQVANLGDIAEIIMGQSPLGKTVLDWDGEVIEGEGLPFVQGNAEFCDRYPMPTKWCAEPLKVAKPDDILLSVRAPVGDMNMADQLLCIGRGLVALRFLTMTSAFGWYAIQVARYRIERLTQGSTFKAIGKSEILKLPVAKPTLTEQQTIVAVLDSIDKYIVELRYELQSLKYFKVSISFAMLLGNVRVGNG